MKKLILFLLLLCGASCAWSQTEAFVKGTGIRYDRGVPTVNPGDTTYSSEYLIDLENRAVYLFNRVTMSWDKQFNTSRGNGAPFTDPGNGPEWYVNNLNRDVYWWNGSIWEKINGSSASSDCELSLEYPYVRVLRIRGQSNSRGRAFNGDLLAGEAGPYDKIFTWDLTQAPNSFEPLHIGVNNYPGAGGNGDTLHGPELGIALELADQCPNDTFYLLKTGIGGTEIARHLPGGIQDVYLQDSLYTIAAINALIGAGRIPVVTDYWIQGESDSGIEEKAMNHYDSMLVMIHNARRLLNKDLPLIIGEIRIAGTPNRYIINNNFNFLNKTTADLGIIRSRDFSGLSEFDSHFDYLGLKRQAEQIVEAWKVLGGTIVADSLPLTLASATVATIDSAFYDFENYSVPTTDPTAFQECRGAHEILSYQASNRIRFDGTSNPGSCACCDAQASTRSLLRFPVVDSTLTDDQYIQGDLLTSDGASTAGLTMVLRYNSNGSGTGYSGYVLWLHPANNEVRIGRVDAGVYTTLSSASFTVNSDTEYLFRFTSTESILPTGTTLTVETSTNGGSSWSTVTSTTDAAYSTGGMAIGAGIGSSSVSTHYFDNLKLSW